MRRSKAGTVKVNVDVIVDVPREGQKPIDAAHARSLLKSYCLSIERNQAVMPGLQQYLARVFRLVLDGTSADKALGLKRDRSGRTPRGEPWLPKTPQERRDCWLAVEVLRLLKEDYKHAQAYETASKRWNSEKRKPSASTATAQRAWKRYENHVRYIEAARQAQQDRPAKERGRLARFGVLYAEMPADPAQERPTRKRIGSQGSGTSERHRQRSPKRLVRKS